MKNILRIRLGILFLLTIYLLPTGLAMLRRAPDKLATVLVNVLLGWTLIGYLVALVPALNSPVPAPIAQMPQVPPAPPVSSSAATT
jgi:hypothetical protein